MEKEIIIAKMHVTMNFTNETTLWIKELQEQDYSIKQPDYFFSEYKHYWNEIFVESTEIVLKKFFKEYSNGKICPKVEVYDTYQGSWNIEAYVVTFAGVLAILNNISKLPEIYNKLMNLKHTMKDSFEKKTADKINELLKKHSEGSVIKNPPSMPLETNIVIDIRPLLSLKTGKIESPKSKSVSVKLKVADLYRLREYADKKGGNPVSHYIREAVSEYLENHT